MRRILILSLLLVAVPAVGQPPGFIDTGQFTVNSYSTSQQIRPDVSHGPDGGFVVVWQDFSAQDGSYIGIQAQRYDSEGNPAGGEFTVNSVTTDSQRHPSVSHGPDGGFVIVWQDYSNEGVSGSEIQAQRYDSQGNPAGGEFTVNSYTTDFQRHPSVSHGSNGGFVVVWHDDSDQNGFGNGIRAQRYDSQGNPAGGEFAVNSYTLNANETQPSVSHGSDGGFVVAWTAQLDGSNYGIEAQRYDSQGDPAGGEFTVNTETADTQRFPSVSHDSDGAFVVVWQTNGGQDGDLAGIRAQRFDSEGNPAGGELAVNSYTTGSQAFPHVSRDPDGAFVVAWVDTSGLDGDDYGIWSRLFDSQGIPVGGDFAVNTVTTNKQHYPSVSHGPNGDFIVVWEDSSGQDGFSGFGIQAKSYTSGLIFEDGFESGDTMPWM